jgi:hypothetical protein
MLLHMHHLLELMCLFVQGMMEWAGQFECNMVDWNQRVDACDKPEEVEPVIEPLAVGGGSAKREGGSAAGSSSRPRREPKVHEPKGRKRVRAASKIKRYLEIGTMRSLSRAEMAAAEKAKAEARRLATTRGANR